MEKQLLIDSCSVYMGDIDLTNPDQYKTLLSNMFLGLTRNGVTVSIKPNIKEIDFDGRKDRKVKGMDRILGWEVGAECETLEIGEKLFDVSLFKKVTTSSTKFDKYVPSGDMAYSNVLLVGTLTKTQEPILVLIKNAYNSEGLTLETKDKDEAGVKMKLVGTYEIGSDEPPVDIFIPKAGELQKVSINEVA